MSKIKTFHYEDLVDFMTNENQTELCYYSDVEDLLKRLNKILDSTVAGNASKVGICRIEIEETLNQSKR